MDHARTLLEQARHDAEAHAREAEEATLEARVLREDLGESRGALSAREAKAKATEETVKVCFVRESGSFCDILVVDAVIMFFCCFACVFSTFFSPMQLTNTPCDGGGSLRFHSSNPIPRSYSVPCWRPEPSSS